MNIPEIVSILTSAGIEEKEATKEVRMLIEHFCNYGAKDIIMGRPLDYEKLKIVKQKAELRAKTRQPIQYIIGQAYFMGNFYKVNPYVLIPRDETELVVLKAISLIEENNFKTALDIGTGSGCIACSISQRTGASVTAVDLSKTALEVAKENAEKLNQKIEFIDSDLFEKLEERKFDIIVSNPPYIPINTNVQKEVEFEPKIALFTSEDTGCEFYKKIIEQSGKYLNKNGCVIFELGMGEAETVKKLFENNGFENIVVEKDLAGIDRVISAGHK